MLEKAGSRASRYDGGRGAMLTWRSNRAFRWGIAVDGAIHESDAHVRADHAAERGVSIPTAWKSELKFSAAEPIVDVEALSHAAVQRARQELSLAMRRSVSAGSLHQYTCTHTSTSTSTHMRAQLQHSSKYDGGSSAILTWRSNRAFRWGIAVGAAIHKSDVQVHVRADHAAERGSHSNICQVDVPRTLATAISSKLMCSER